MSIDGPRRAGPGSVMTPGPRARLRRALLCVAPLIAAALGSGCASKEPVRTLPLPTSSALASPTTCLITAKLEPTCGTWFGAAPGVRTAQRPDVAMYAFERSIGRKLDIMHTFHRDADLFPTSWEIKVAREPKRPRMLLINWKPEMGRSWARVAKGDPVVDRQIDRLATHIKKNFDQRFFLTIHHEPEEEVKPKKGSGYTADDYRAMYRHVVQRLRSHGATKIVTVMTYMGWAWWCTKPWFENLYPGNDVVDWIAYDPFVFGKATNFAALVNPRSSKSPQWPGFYNWATKFAPDKPIMMAEWGIFERKGDPKQKPWFFWKVGDEIGDFPRLKAMLYFESPNTVGGDSRVNTTKDTLDAFKELARLPRFNKNKVPAR